MASAVVLSKGDGSAVVDSLLNVAQIVYRVLCLVYVLLCSI